MSGEPESLVLQILRQMRAEIADLRENSVSKADLATLRAELAEVRAELKSDIADVAADLLQTRKELGEQIVGLRRAVIDYHTNSSATGGSSATSRRGCGGSSSISTFPRSARAERPTYVPALLWTAAAPARRFSTIFTAITAPS